MSLTVLVHEKLPVAIVRWFLDSKGLVLFANGPVIEMPLEEFRAKGHEWVERHFEEYSRVRLPEDEFIKVFQPGEGRKFMRNRRVLEIHVDIAGNLIFSPMVVEKYDLADLKRVKPVCERTIPANSPADVFWNTFDAALADAPPDE